ncbi:MAG: HAD-IA family hydrolase [Paracoccaceae bacterium]
MAGRIRNSERGTAMRAAIFDLDGTLADTSDDLIAAANSCFERDWLDPVADVATAFAGGRAMLRLALERAGDGVDQSDFETLFGRFLEAYSAGLDVHSQLYPGAAECLERLSGAGWRLGVCTNKPEALARRLLHSLGVLPVLGALVGADTLPVRKPDPRPLQETARRLGVGMARTVMIGDSAPDLAAALAAGVPGVICTFYARPPGDPPLRAAASFSHFRQLPALLDRMIPVTGAV